MHGEQRLVGRDHVLAGGDGFEHQRLGNAVAADQLNDDINVRVGDDGAGVAHHLHVRTHHAAGTDDIQVGHHGDGNAPAGAALDLFLVAREHIEYAAANGADAEEAYLDGFHQILSKKCL